MSTLLDVLTGAGNLLVVALGFSLIIVIHEAGHFFAAKWAGIRVLAFAVGFGPAIVSFRKGLGFRRGSSEGEYQAMLHAPGDVGEATKRAISTTEYRLNVLPLGGYVKMLGQDDADPGARSEEPDSYQNCPPIKRMVIISAGVIANLVTAAIAFIVVFSVGMKMNHAVIGYVTPSMPAAKAVAVGAPGVEPGLKTGDKVLSVDGEPVAHFNELQFKIAYAAPKTAVRVVVEREGVQAPLTFEVMPEPSPGERLLSIGVGPLSSDRLPDAPSRRTKAALAKQLAANGLGELEPGMRLVAVNGERTSNPYAIDAAAKASGGQTIRLTFIGDEGAEKTVNITPTPEMQQRTVRMNNEQVQDEHLAGLQPVLGVDSVVPGKEAERIGLQPNDIFARIGSVEFPSRLAGIVEIRKSKGTSIPIAVLRKGNDGEWTRVDLGQGKVSTEGEGTLGFQTESSAGLTSIIAGADGEGALAIPAGARLLEVSGEKVETLGDVRSVIAKLGADATESRTVKVKYALPSAGAPVQETTWVLSAQDLRDVAALKYRSRLSSADFAPEEFAYKADGIGQAVQMGFNETYRTMAMTYLTFARLFQGTVKVENLRGPVGIAHIGLSVVERGPTWLLFFFALISINLAVINFLPIPITDGGHMLFLLYEQATGKAVSIAVQNVATIAGLALIGTLFILVTFNDVSRVVRDISAFLGQ